MKHLFFSLVTLAVFGCTAQKTETSIKSKNYQIAFYNVENLFDTLNAEGKNDGEYTPEGKKEWNTEKYNQKLDRIAQVIASIDSTEQLAAIGLAEIENRLVLEDLAKHKLVSHLNLKIVHKESPDFRGIDVALLYNPKLISVVGSEFLYVDINDTGKTTRDILKAQIVDHTNDSLLVYINHWPSRWGGQEKTNRKRVAAATVLKNDLKSVNLKSSNVLILGDLNDYPTNESVWTVLNADSSAENDGSLFNATYKIHIDSTQGTHAYRGHWGVLDHAILTPTLNQNVDSVYVHKRKYMLYENKGGDWFPSRTHSGKRYYGGYSDHLPVVVNFK